MGHDIYGYGPGFFCVAQGIMALVCFIWYVQMLRTSEINYDLVIGFSCGLILVFLQGCVLWGALQGQVFEDLFLTKFVTAVNEAEATDPTCTACTQEESDQVYKAIKHIGHNIEAEQAAAAFSAIALVTQIALLAVVVMQKASATGSGGTTTASTYGNEQDKYVEPEPIQEDDL